ncbi:unnamed protein product [Darwinula stevensoni]|uniref:THD domain-containing protein n=1 Tax=Darwinula stevensoni TaxID=69355 RepID=A0A7R9A6L1_9CRUS|nr:unnamed protein product [Darwinula stevensoni]CAG0889555.1 unnamed protein product [Darwinula stevensoni]
MTFVAPVEITTKWQSKIEFKGKYVRFVAFFVLVLCIVSLLALVAVLHLHAVSHQLRSQVEDLQGQIQGLRGNLEDLQSQINRVESGYGNEDLSREDFLGFLREERSAKHALGEEDMLEEARARDQLIPWNERNLLPEENLHIEKRSPKGERGMKQKSHGVPKQQTRNGGPIPGWTYEEESNLRVHFNEKRTNVQLQHPGVYFVYAQLYYINNNISHGFDIFYQKENLDTKPSILSSCSVSTASSGASCFTATIAPLDAHDQARVFVQQRQEARNIDLNLGKSYLGIVRLGDLPNAVRHRKHSCKPVEITTKWQSKIEFKGKYVRFVAFFVLVLCIVSLLALVAVLHLHAVSHQLRSQVEDLQGQIQGLRGDLDDLQYQITIVKACQNLQDSPGEELSVRDLLQDPEDEDIEKEGPITEEFFGEEDLIDDRNLDGDKSGEDLLAGESKNREKRSPRKQESEERKKDRKGNRDRHRHRQEIDDGKIPDWRHEIDSNLLVELNSNKTAIRIRESGLYFIYAQLYYFNEERSNGFELCHQSDGLNAKPVNLSTCSVSTARQAATCFTAAVKVFIQQREKSRKISLDPGRSFLGLVRLGEAPQSLQNGKTDICAPVEITTRWQSKIEFKGRYVRFVAFFVLVLCIVSSLALVAVLHLHAVSHQLRFQVEELEGQVRSLRGNLEDLQFQITRVKSEQDRKDSPREESLLEDFLEGLEEEDFTKESSKEDTFFLEDGSVDEGSLDEVLLAEGYINREKRSPQERGRKGKSRDRQKHHRQESDDILLGNGLADGQIPDWQYEAESNLRVQFNSEKTAIRLEEPGVYFIYAQLYYLNYEGSNGFELYYRSDNINAKPAILSTCSVSTARTGSSCFTATVKALSKDDQAGVYIQQREASRNIDLNPGKSYLGIIRLGDKQPQLSQHGKRKDICD